MIDLLTGDCDGPWMIFLGSDAQAFGSAYASAVGCTEAGSQLSCLRDAPLTRVLVPYAQWSVHIYVQCLTPSVQVLP